MLKRILSLFRNLFRKRTVEEALDDELRSSVEVLTQKKVKNGVSQSVARREALIELGGVEQVKEEVRAIRAGRLLEDFTRDLRFAFRTLAKSPGFTTVAILTLALGIGANTTIFSMVDWLTLRLPPVAHPRQIVTLDALRPHGGYTNGFSYPDYSDVRKQSTAVFSNVAASADYQPDGFTFDGMAQSIWTSYVTGNYFELMGVKPELGNFFGPARGTAVNDEPVLVLGYSFWKSRFDGTPSVIGKSVLLNGHPVTIIGVAPRGFHGITSLLDTQAFLPLGMAAVTADAPKGFAVSRDKLTYLTIIARLRPDTPLRAAQPALTVIAHRLYSEHPNADKWKNLVAYSLNPASPIGDPSELTNEHLMSVLFLTLAALVLLLACLNIANLLLVRASGCQREMAVRAAVGGGRLRLICQLLTESLLLALLGCAAGILLGLIGSRYASAISLHGTVPLVVDLRLDWRVFAYALGAAGLTVLLVGIAPALRATRGDLNNLLHENARTTTSSHQRTRSILVVAQVGGSLMLLIVAGLFVRSLRSVEHKNLGFDPNHVLNFTVNPHQAGFNDAQSRRFLSALLTRLRALPGVETASLAATVPMGYTYNGIQFTVEGYHQAPKQNPPSAGCNGVSSQYFHTMRISILRGRGFLNTDTKTSLRVAVINEAMAEKYWHGQNPLGHHFTSTDDPKHPIEVVGVVSNSRAGSDFSGAIEPYVYLPLFQHYDYSMPATLQLRTNLPAASVNHQALVAIQGLAPSMPVTDIQTMTGALETLNGFMLFQIAAALAGSLGILGLVLAIVGIYGVVSYGATQRTHEIGIRMALGAQPLQIHKLIFRQGFLVVGAGVIVGVLAAAAMARLVGSFIVGVSSLDPLTYLGASLLLAATALAACYIPARRAMRTDPMVALKYE